MTVTAHTRRYGIQQQLPRKWAVRNVNDVEAFCQRVVERACQRSRMPRLERADLAEAIGHLLGQVAILDQQFDAKQAAKPYLIFDLWLWRELTCDLIDFWRTFYGRQGQHRVTALPPPTGHNDDEWFIDQRDPLDEDDAGASRLERVVAELTVDPPDVGDVFSRWLLTEGDLAALRAVGGHGRDEAAGAAARPDPPNPFVTTIEELIAA